MCINLSYENKIYLSGIKAKLSKTIDIMNDSFVYLVEELDKKYTQFGGIVLKKFNSVWSSSNFKSKYQNYRYTRANSGNIHPNSRISLFEIISKDISGEISQTNVNSNVVINIEESNTIVEKPKEMVDNHFIDNTESFLDDAWDIINGND